MRPLLSMGALLLSVFISYDLFAQASVVTGSIATSKTNYSPGAGNNRAIVIAVSQEVTDGNRTISSITWGGQALTSAVVRSGGVGNNDLRAEIWYLEEAKINAATSYCNSFVITWSAAPTDETVIVFTLKNVDQTTPVTASNSASTNSNTIALPSVAVASDDIVCYASATQSGANTHTPAAGYTELADQSPGAHGLAVATKQITAGGTEAPSAVWNGTNEILIAGAVFNGVANSVTTYYSLATGAWDANTSWSYSADGSSGAVPAGVWPRRHDNVVIRSGHNITVDEIDDNKSCGISPDGLGRTNVGPNFAASSVAMFYQIGDILISGTLTVSGIEMMTEGYTRVTSGATFSLTSSLVNLGFLEVDAGATLFRTQDDLILAGYSTTIINTSSILTDDLIISFTDARLCGTGVTALQNGAGSQITYVNSAGVSQICTSFQVTCPGGGCTGGPFPVTGTGIYMLGNTGPGGVGNSTNNKLWLRANDLSLANGAAVASWSDVSGNSLTASNPTAGERPTFVTASANGFPSLSFDGTTDNLSLGAPAALNFIPQTDSWSFLIAYRSPANGATTTPNQGTLFSKAWTSNRNYQYQIDDISGTASAFASYIGNNLDGGTVQINTNAWVISAHTNNTTTKSSWSNETANFSNINIAAGADAATEVLIGARRDTGPANGSEGFLFTGNIAELMMYNRQINTAHRIIISNYLAAKYGITLSANDVYTMDNAGNGNFDYEVAGIGQASDNSTHRDAMGSGIVRMWNPSGLSSNEFLMWGHDGTMLYSSTTAGVGAPIEERLSRTWRVDKFGDVGTVSVSFNLDLLGTPLGSNLRLLIDRNGNGFADNDVTPVAGSFVDNTVVFSNINFQDGDRFTLGNTDVGDPLPIELVRFRAVAEENIVRLSWTTASETNNDYFTVERSRNALEWETVRRVAGAGTSKAMNHYETVDDGPYRGASYYRLKQTDFDLRSKYSDLVRVVVDHETPITLHPNPFRDHVTLAADFEPEHSQVKLYNSSGTEVPFTMKHEGPDLIITPGNIPQGLYILKILDRFVTRTAKLIKTD